VTLNVVPEDMAMSFDLINPLSIEVQAGGTLSITDSRIVAPEWGPLGGFQIVALADADLAIENSEIYNAGIWSGDGAVAIEDGADSAVVEGNRFYRTYCAVSLEGGDGAQVVDNTISDSVFGINAIGGKSLAITGNEIAGTAWKGVNVESETIDVAENEIIDGWGIGVFPNHWGVMPGDNTFRDFRGPGMLFQDPGILTGPKGFRAFSYDPADVQQGQQITVFVRLSYTSPIYGLPGMPETIFEILGISFDVHLRVNGRNIATEGVTVDLGDTAMVKLTGTAPEDGVYDVKIDQLWPDAYAGLPSVTTADVTEIGALRASSGGDVTHHGFASVTDRGVCWSREVNPTVSGFKTSDGVGSGCFISEMTDLHAGTSYHVRAYATNKFGTSYGSDMAFTTAESDIVYVEAEGICGGWSPCYSRIQDGISCAPEGATVKIAEGCYAENIQIARDVTLEIGWDAAFATPGNVKPVVLAGEQVASSLD
jgi:hypothetical protein